MIDRTALKERIKSNILKAESMTDPLHTMKAFTTIEIKFQKPSVLSGDDGMISKQNGDDTETKNQAYIEFYRAPLPKDLHNICMDLFEKNMSNLYKNSSWGLDLKSKSNEFNHDSARFLIVRCNGRNESIDNCIAFSHFRFELNDDADPTEEVLYVYEIQVDPNFQKYGIGKHCMSIMELIALRAGMRRVMLTVFKENNLAMKFYRNKMKYSIDESSPSNFLGGDDEDYEILSKSLVKKK